jgi:hypothetical protein
MNEQFYVPLGGPPESGNNITLGNGMTETTISPNSVLIGDFTADSSVLQNLFTLPLGVNLSKYNCFTPTSPIQHSFQDSKQLRKNLVAKYLTMYQNRFGLKQGVSPDDLIFAARSYHAKPDNSTFVKVGLMPEELERITRTRDHFGSSRKCGSERLSTVKGRYFNDTPNFMLLQNNIVHNADLLISSQDNETLSMRGVKGSIPRGLAGIYATILLYTGEAITEIPFKNYIRFERFEDCGVDLEELANPRNFFSPDVLKNQNILITRKSNKGGIDVPRILTDNLSSIVAHYNRKVKEDSISDMSQVLKKQKELLGFYTAAVELIGSVEKRIDSNQEVYVYLASGDFNLRNVVTSNRRGGVHPHIKPFRIDTHVFNSKSNPLGLGQFFTDIGNFEADIELIKNNPLTLARSTNWYSNADVILNILKDIWLTGDLKISINKEVDFDFTRTCASLTRCGYGLSGLCKALEDKVWT